MFNDAPRMILALSCLLAASCAGSQERLARRNLTERSDSTINPSQEPRLNSASSQSPRLPEPLTPQSDQKIPSEKIACSGLSEFIAHALRESPQLASEFENYRAEVHAISAHRRLPNPVLSFGYYLRSVETRVGPQQARVGLSFSFPWPSKLIAGTDAASAQARAAEQRFNALALDVAANVQTAYWQLWRVRKARLIHKEHLSLIESLAESVLARVATSQTNLAEQQQIGLSAARLEDEILGMNQEERSAEASLRAATSLAPDTPLATCTEPQHALPPAELEKELRQSLAQHPLLDALEERALAADATVRMKAAARLPSFTVGADWILTGDPDGTNPPDSGKDAVVLGGGIQIPLWQGSYGDDVKAAKARAKSARYRKRAQLDRAEAALTAVYSRTVDEARRVFFYQSTLIPQADAAYDSVLGAYTTGEATVAQTLLAQKDVLEIHVQVIEARATHASAWAQLENIVGREVRASATVAHHRKVNISND